MSHSKRGFTLTEVSVTVACLALLLSVLLPYGNGILEQQKKNIAQVNLQMLGKQCQIYFAKERVWPRQLSDLSPSIANEALFRDVTFKMQGAGLLLQQGAYHVRINQKPSAYGVLFHGL